MSPRRMAAPGEDSILAMLEREPARRRAGGSPGLRRAWYGAGATVALALTAALVWIAANNDGRRPDAGETLVADATAARGQMVPGLPAAPATVLQVALAPVAEARQAGAAVIVDQAAPGETMPPLRLLKPAPGKAAAQQPVPAARATTSPPLAAAAPARSVTKAGLPARPATVTPARALARPAASPAKSSPAMVAKHAARQLQPRSQRAVPPAATAQAPVDADVALISAVIVHANGHAPEGSQMTELLCPNDACQARPPRR